VRLVLVCIASFRFREAYKFTVEHSVYVNENHHGRDWKTAYKNSFNLLSQKLHTMIAVIDAENQSSIEFHENLVLKL
jgi:phosphinothricin acetyltransferase